MPEHRSRGEEPMTTVNIYLDWLDSLPDMEGALFIGGFCILLMLICMALDRWDRGRNV